MLVIQPSVDDRTDSMDHVVARQVIGRRDLRLTGRLIMTLPCHDFVAFASKLYARKGMDRVVDTAVTGGEAPKHLRVGGVDDRAAFQ